MVRAITSTVMLILLVIGSYFNWGFTIMGAIVAALVGFELYKLDERLDRFEIQISRTTNMVETELASLRRELDSITKR